MPRTRKNYAPSLKAKVAIEAIRGVKTAAQIAQSFDIHPALAALWKKQAVEQMQDIFSGRQASRAADADKDELYQQIGRLKVELDFLKKRTGLSD